MNADELIQGLALEIYEMPLARVRDEVDYPNLNNPLHLVVLLIEADTEVEMNGMLGFLENMTGRHLARTIEALQIIGAKKCAEMFKSVEGCMKTNEISWERLRADFAGTAKFQVTTFHKLHGEQCASFAAEVGELAQGFSLFNTLYSPEDAYAALCVYLETRLLECRKEIDKRRT